MGCSTWRCVPSSDEALEREDMRPSASNCMLPPRCTARLTAGKPTLAMEGVWRWPADGVGASAILTEVLRGVVRAGGGGACAMARWPRPDSSKWSHSAISWLYPSSSRKAANSACVSEGSGGM